MRRDVDPLEPPLVSVLMPCYDTPGVYLEQAVASALAQPLPVEVLLQDGGSTRPDTVAALHALAADPRVRLVSEPDRGQSDALNRALARARGDLVAWLNADDVLSPEALAQLAAFLRERPELDGGYGDMAVMDADGRTLRTFRTSAWRHERIFRRGCYVFSGSLLLRTELLRRVGGFDPDLRYCMDLDLYLRLGPGVRMGHLPGRVAALRLHGDSKTGSVAHRFAGEGLEVRRRHARGPRDRALARYVYCRTQLTVLAQPIRMTRLYGALRGARTL